jgi:hypothetical protein
LQAHLQFSKAQKPNKKLQKSLQATARQKRCPMKTTDKIRRKTEGQPITAVWRNGGCSASYDSFVVGSSAVLRLNFCAINPPLRQAAKR